MDVRRLVAWNLGGIASSAKIDHTHVSSVERGLENPTVLVLDNPAAALSISIANLFRVPSRGERPPKPLSAGRRTKSK
jgi:transcriptional regulator with XRE-family HTH domain